MLPPPRRDLDGALGSSLVFGLSVFVWQGFLLGSEKREAMSWRYRAGLVLIGAVVIIWVSSAEVTQVRFILVICFFF